MRQQSRSRCSAARGGAQPAQGACARPGTQAAHPQPPGELPDGLGLRLGGCLALCLGRIAQGGHGGRHSPDRLSGVRADGQALQGGVQPLDGLLQPRRHGARELTAGRAGLGLLLPALARALRSARMSAAELRLFVQPDETALQLAQRAKYEPIRSGVPALGNLRAAQLLEISGPSGSAKTELLMQARAPCRERTVQAGRAAAR